MSRKKRAETEQILKALPIANTYQVYYSAEAESNFNALSQTLAKLKGFLQFLTKLDWAQFLHFMNHACVKPARDVSLKNKMAMPEPSSKHETYSDVVIKGNGETQTQSVQPGKRKGLRRRFAASK
ncbi:hypothetical protein CC99x_006520 [Candidatus Berkiella cookevillensis]|uniref:Uncharacterized protein n=1 Tax=Candidatus Berkiella cookevillensis TaxID=437022 RepID=A0A0Q9YQ90_9GAMM|nr:hypothetical protein [Candidatus Berkiella cookevillensis]MCS5708561.1 hypothetical protein [Candidatus Berkiella cookevillensis]